MVSFIVTAFNEEDNIALTMATLQSVVQDARLTDYEIIVVDDGSTDGTAERIAELLKTVPRLRCVRHPVNRGLGCAVRSGIEAAKYPQFMIIPGDNDMHRDFVMSMLRFRGQADLILSAPLNKEMRSLGRNLVSMIYQMIYMVSFDLFLSYINGPGIWPTERVREIGLRSRRFAIISEMNVKLLRGGCSFAEVPGYFQAGPKARRTVTLKNLAEIGESYLLLLFEVHVRRRGKYARRPTRVPVRLIDLP